MLNQACNTIMVQEKDKNTHYGNFMTFERLLYVQQLNYSLIMWFNVIIRVCYGSILRVQ